MSRRWLEYRLVDTFNAIWGCIMRDMKGLRRLCLVPSCFGVLGFWLTCSDLLAAPGKVLAKVPAHKSNSSAKQKNSTARSRQFKSEVVMKPGMRISANTSVGKIAITATGDLTRSYTWEGATRSVEMWPRAERWNGSLGLYYPGPGEHWKEHNGITRGVVEEGQMHFKSRQEAIKWVLEPKWIPYVHRDDGLVVGWSKTLERKQLNVDVWQIYINGKKPHRLPGSRNELIQTTFLPVPKPGTSLIEAVRMNNLKAVQALLAKGANPNSRNSAGIPVLTVAAGHGYTAVAEALLRRGASPNAKDDTNEGATALLEAATYEHAGVAKLLLAHGADANATYDKGALKGSTALMLASMSNNDSLIKILLDGGAQVNAATEDGDTALHRIASATNAKGARLLLSHGAVVDARNWFGMTPLMTATLAGNVEMVKLLISKGANVNARSDAARRAYGRAAFMGDTITMKQMTKSGRLTILHEDGDSALDLADVLRKTEIIALLKKAGAK